MRVLKFMRDIELGDCYHWHVSKIHLVWTMVEILSKWGLHRGCNDLMTKMIKNHVIHILTSIKSIYYARLYDSIYAWHIDAIAYK